MKKTFLSAILMAVLCMGLSLFSASAEGKAVGALALPVPTISTDNWLDYAEAVTEKDGVYEISTAEQFAWVAKQMAMMKTDFESKTLKLTADIDLSSHLWTPIGHGNMAFKGNFDGQNHTVSGLIITDASQAGDYVGLFGYVGYNAKLQNIAITDAYINVTTAVYAGTLAGNASYSITNCSVSNITVTGSGFYTGGLVGTACNPITNCSVSNATVTGGACAGGLVGYVPSTSSITNCSVSNTAVTGTEYDADIGGLCGSVNAKSIISNSFAVVSLTAKDQSSAIGGLVGSNYGSISNCYAVADSVRGWYGIAGISSGTVMNCYYNNSATAGFGSNTGRAFDCRAMTDADMKADAFVSILNGYWDEVTDEIKYKYWAKDTANANGGFPILVYPKVTSLEVVAPSFKGGAVQFKFRGEHFDKVSAAFVFAPYSGSSYVLSDTAVANASLITASYTPSQYSWSETADGYTYSGTVYLTVDGKQTSYPYTALIPFEAKAPKITSLSYTKTLTSAGGIAEITLVGDNLADYQGAVTLTAASSLVTVRATEYVKEGSTLRMRLALPANTGKTDTVYTLSVSLGSTVQSIPNSTVTVKAPLDAEANSPFDLNGDRSVNILDVIFLLRHITEVLS